MGKRKSITPIIRAQAVALSSTGMTQRQIAAQLNISLCSVNLAIKKDSTTGALSDAPRSGRPRITTKRDDRVLKGLVQKDPTISLPELSCTLRNAGVIASTSTLSRRLRKEIGLKSYKPAKKPKLTPAMAKKRLAFARRHAHFTAMDWENIMWSDETTIEQFGTRVRHIRRPKGERYNPRYIVQTMKHPLKQMIWGCMSSRGRGGLFFLPRDTNMNGITYLNLLKDKLEQHMNIHYVNTFMHDGAPCHRSKIVTQWLESKFIRVLEWPGNSPDCNPIENLWTILKDHVASMRPTSLEHLKDCIKLAWTTKITPEYCSSLVHSMPRRMAEVIKQKGYQTHY